MTNPRPGATPGEWAHFADMLGLAQDLLPVVSRAGAVISPQSKMKATGKTPSRYNASGEVVGIPHWTAIRATSALIDKWSSQDDYGICLQTRSVRAIDVDVDDLALAGQIRARIAQVLGVSLPARARPGTGRVVLGCTVVGEQSKRVVRLPARQCVEYLADGQQFVVAGAHSSGAGRYFWEGGLPSAFPVVDAALLARCLDALEQEFAGTELAVAGGGVGQRRGASDRGRARVVGAGQRQQGESDPVALWLDARGFTRAAERGRNAELLIHCPFELEHSGDSGETETVYYGAGTGGFDSGHFKCLHAHCAHRTDADFLHAVGWTQCLQDEVEVIDDDDSMADAGRTGVRRGGFVLAGRGVVGDARADTSGQHPASAVGAGRARLPGDPARVHGSRLGGGVELPEHPTDAWASGTPGKTLARSRKGYVATVRNLERALLTLGYWRCVGHDDFRDEVMWCDWAGWAAGDARWRSWTDEDYTRLRIQLEADGFEPVGREVLRDVVALVARTRTFDSAQAWLERLAWDGTPRVERWLEAYCGAAPSDYARAVSRYLWSALAGRVIVPGIKADMVPILVGAGGARKTSMVKALAPSRAFVSKIDLKDSDADNARKMRGCLVIEVAELRGLAGRDSESIKDFFSEEHDKWTPKYKEFANEVRRRCVFVGTTDNEQFLTDSVGNYRRWLPVGVSSLRVEALDRDRDQLWAEAASRFVWHGVEWQDAEALAASEHADYVLEDDWTDAIEAWSKTKVEDAEIDLQVGGETDLPSGVSWACFGFSSAQALTYGVGLAPSQVNTGSSRRAAQVLRALGFKQGRASRGTGRRGARVWRQMEPPDAT